MNGTTASDAARRGPGGPRWRLSSAVAIAGAAVSLACIPAAIAKTAHQKPSAPVSQQPSVTATPDAPPSGEAGGEVSGASAPAPPEHPRGNSAPGPRLADHTPVPVKSTGGEEAAKRAAEAATRREEAATRREEAAKLKEERDLRHAEAQQQRVAATQQRREVIKQHVEGAVLQTRVRKQTQEVNRRLSAAARELQSKAERQATHGSGGGAGKREGAGPAPGSSAGSSAAAPNAAKAQLAAAASTASVGAGRPGTGASHPAVALGAPSRSIHAGHARVSRRSTRAAAQAKAGRAAAARAAASLPVTPATTGATAGSTHTVAPVKKPPVAQRASAPSQIVTTITKIVGVVPSAVWMLVAALVALALALAARTRLSARRARRLESQRAELLEDVGLLQAALLPVTPARLGPVATTAAYRPAAGPAAGGDFYDIFALEDGKLAVIVGDVSGHGREALPHTALLRFTLRAYLEAGLSPRVAMQTTGAVLERQLGGSFATVVAATYDPRERVLVYSCAGHPPPIVIGSGEPVPVTVASAPPVGVGMRTGTRQTTVSLPGAAIVCFHTDGVTEARIAGELYGSERLSAALGELSGDGTATDLLALVSEQTDRRPDDMAACLLRIEGDSATPVIVAEELELDRNDAIAERTERFLVACGLEPYEVEAVTRDARASAVRAGNVILDLRRGEGRPEVTLQRDNLAYIQPRQATPRTDLKVSL